MQTKSETSTPEKRGLRNVVGLGVLVLIVLLAWRFIRIGPASLNVGQENKFDKILAGLTLSSIPGFVESIRGNEVSIEVRSILDMPVSPVSEFRHRTVIVSDDTRLYEELDKPMSQFRKEEKTYLTTLSKNKKTLPPPPSTRNPITINDLKPGDRLILIAPPAINLATAKEFKASTIVVKRDSSERISKEAEAVYKAMAKSEKTP